MFQTAQLSFARSPQYWKDPLQYRPERLLTVVVDGKSANPAWAPFGDVRTHLQCPSTKS